MNQLIDFIKYYFRDESNFPPRTTLHEDAAGLKLFLDLLNGHENQNPETETELR